MIPRIRRRSSLARAALPVMALWAFAFAEGATPAARATVRFGVIAEEANEPDRMLRVYADLIAEMRKRLTPKGLAVAPLVIAEDLGDMSRRVKQGEIDIVIETLFATLELQEQSGQLVTPHLAIVRREQREYHSVFFARKAGTIKSLEDLRGRTLVLQAERSTSAFAVPRAALARRGIGLVPSGQAPGRKDAAFYVLAGAELNQAIWVLNGRGDAGAFNEGDWARLPAKVRGELVIFHETQPMLRGVLSLRSGLDAGTKRICEQVLLALNADAAGQTALASASGITRFERLTPKDLADLNEWRLALKGVSAPQ